MEISQPVVVSSPKRNLCCCCKLKLCDLKTLIIIILIIIIIIFGISFAFALDLDADIDADVDIDINPGGGGGGGNKKDDDDKDSKKDDEAHDDDAHDDEIIENNKYSFNATYLTSEYNEFVQLINPIYEEYIINMTIYSENFTAKTDYYFESIGIHKISVLMDISMINSIEEMLSEID